MTIKSVNEHYDYLTEINDTAEINVEVHAERSFIVVDDFLKRPDEFKQFIENYPHWDNKAEDTGFSRPGRSAMLPLVAGKFIANYLDNVFGLDKFSIHSVYTNCINGKMKVVERSKLPHTDGSKNNFLACNIFLSETSHGGTGFWSVDDGHRQKPAISMHHLNSFDKKNLSNSYSSQILTDWEQYDNIDMWTLDYVFPHKYNRLMVYSGTLFHNPYVKPEWYNDEDRLSFVTMLNPDYATNLIDSDQVLTEQYKKLRDIFYLTTPNY